MKVVRLLLKLFFLLRLELEVGLLGVKLLSVSIKLAFLEVPQNLVAGNRLIEY